MINPDLLFTAQTVTPPRVAVFFGTKAIHEITGPVPMVDISHNINYTEGGAIDSIVHQITLTGKILKTANSNPDVNGNPRPSGGLTPIVNSIKQLQDLFVNCANGTFGISCDNSMIYLATGVKVTSFNADKTEDHWTQSADYSVSMEYKTGSDPSDPDDQVENRNDSWTIEPLDDISYTNFTVPIDQRGEWSNPQMKPTAPSVGNLVPSASVGGGAFGAASLKVLHVPQFRISRRVSAKGLPLSTGTPSSSGLICRSGQPSSSSFINAKRWVEKRLKTPFYGGKTTNSSGQIIDTESPFFADFYVNNNFAAEFNRNKTWLYNHTRSINVDVMGGTYEANDSWLAMPTGTPFIEQYTIETSTNEQYTKTVRVAGNIQGLSLSPTDVMLGSTGVFPSGTGRSISLEYSTISSMVASNLNLDIPDIDGSEPSHNQSILDDKYINARNAWTKDIKPYLYRRASLAINSIDRTLLYVNPALGATPSPPNNPIYSKEVLLSTIPVSTTEGHDPRKGTISYSYEYNNRLALISGVISENINISNDAPSDVVSETNVIGRARGPILQKTGTTSTRKTVSIEVVVVPPTGIQECFISNVGCPLFTGGFIYQTIEKLIEGIKPFGIEAGTETTYNELFGSDFVSSKNRQGIVFKQSDNDSWNPTGGRYSRNVSWVYQQCSDNKYYLDH